MKNLKDILTESFQAGRVYSNPYATAFIKENEEEKEPEMELSEEQKKAFLEAVKQYKKYGESVYRNAGLGEVYESIKNMVEVANKMTLSETGDWFDNVTVSRHMKRMGESFNVFEKTLKEVSTLQQRLEASYDEIGEVLGKYYEISEELDPVGKEDADIDNDGDVDASDEYLANRRKVISKAIKNESMKLTDIISVNEDTKKRFDVDFYKGDGDRQTSHEEIIRGDKFSDVVSQATKVAKSKGMNYVEFYYKDAFIGSIDKRSGYQFKKGRNSEKSPLSVNESHFKVGDKVEMSHGGVGVIKSLDKEHGEDDEKYYNVELPNGDVMKHAPNELTLINSTSVTESFADPLEGFPQAYKDLLNKLQRSNDRSERYMLINKMNTIRKKLNLKPLKNESVNEGKYDIGMARKGNGITVYNRAEEESGDYKNVAHISDNGTVKYYDKKLPNDVKKKIEAEAQKMKESVNESNEFAGWVAIYNRNRIEIDKSEAKDLWGAKQIAIKKLNVPKSKQGLLAIKPAYNESVNEGVKLSLVDPNTNKFIKTLSLDRTYKEAEKEIETLNRRLSSSQKTKGLYWKVTSIGESVNESGGTLKIEKRKDGKYYWTFKFKSGKVEDWPNGFDNKADAQKDFMYRSKYLRESVNEGKSMKLTSMLKESFGFGQLPSSKLMKMKVPAKDMLDSVKPKKKVNEVASRTAMEIGGLTGMNKDAIQKFVDSNELDIEKVYQFVKNGKLKDRMDLVTAIAGKPGNKIQTMFISKFKK
jgi:hypothetical protein